MNIFEYMQLIIYIYIHTYTKEYKYNDVKNCFDVKG